MTCSRPGKNMFGITAPLVAAAGHANRLEEARRLMAVADSALKRGDMAAFAAHSMRFAGAQCQRRASAVLNLLAH